MKVFFILLTEFYADFYFLYGVINFSPFKEDYVLRIYSNDGLF